MTDRPMTVVDNHSDNFDQLKQAFKDNLVALIECQEVATGDSVAVIAAVNYGKNDEVEVVPFARMFKENPYSEWRAPNPDGGFFPAPDEEEE